MKIRLMLALIDLAGVLSSRRFCWRTPLGALCLETAGSDEIRSRTPMFFLTVWSRGSVAKLLSVAIMRHVFLRSIVKSKIENDTEAEF
jgi:hypothetical protein